MSEIVNEAYEILTEMERGEFFPTEHLAYAWMVINSYPVSNIKRKGQNTVYNLVGASLWLAGCVMGRDYYQPYNSIVEEIIHRKLGKMIYNTTVSKFSKKMQDDTNVIGTLLEIWELYGKPELPHKLKSLENLKRS